MRKSIKTLAVTSAVVAGLAAAPALYAHDSKESDGSMTGSGMMDRRGGMTGEGGMMSMMQMMQQMGPMMESCTKMMQTKTDRMQAPEVDPQDG